MSLSKIEMILFALFLGVSNAAAQDASPDTPESTTYENWRVTCDGAEPCRMSQVVVQPSTGRLIVQAKVFKSEPATLLLTFPLGILLSTGWRMDIDGSAQSLQPFEICNVEGCHVGVPLSNAQLSSLKRGNTLNILFFDAAKNEVAPKLSLIGFTKAFDALP
jgi:invasion protein IalB